jgi:hypothetical protein
MIKSGNTNLKVIDFSSSHFPFQGRPGATMKISFANADVCGEADVEDVVKGSLPPCAHHPTTLY